MDMLDARRPRSPQRRRPLRRHAALVVGTAAAIVCLGALGPRPFGGADAANTVSAQPAHVPRALDITPIGTFGGPITAVAVDGTRVFAMRGAWLEAYDGRDPAHLAIEGRVLVPGAEAAGAFVVRMAAGGERVAVELAEGDPNAPTTLWHVFEVRPGRAPMLGGSLRFAEQPFWTYEVAAAIATGHLFALGAVGMRVIDVRDAARPAVVRTILGPVSAMAMADGRLVLAQRRDGAPTSGWWAVAYDVREPARPAIVAERPVAGSVRALGIHRGQLLVWISEGRDPNTSLSLLVLSAEPPTLTVLGTVAVGQYDWLYSTFTIIGDHVAYLSWDIRRGVSIETFDLRTLPARLPRGEGYRSFVGYGVSIAALGDALLVVGEEGALVTLGSDNSGGFEWRGAVDTLGAPHGLASDGRRVYTADDDGEIWVLDATLPISADAVTHARLALPDGTRVDTAGASMALEGDRLYVASAGTWVWGSDYAPGNVTMVDVADPATPRLRSIWTAGGDPSLRPAVNVAVSSYGPWVVGSRLLATGWPSLFDLNLDDPVRPRAVRLYDPDCGPGDGPLANVVDPYGCDGRGVAVDGDRAFLARGSDGIQVFDVAPDGPSDPVQTFATGGDALDVAVTDRAVFVANGDAGLHVIDRHSARTADLSGLFAAYRITLVGDTAYLVGWTMAAGLWSGWASVWAVDVTDPLAPVVRGHVTLTSPGTPQFDYGAPPHVLVLGDLLLTTVPGRGIAEFRLADGRPLPASRLLLPSVGVAR